MAPLSDGEIPDSPWRYNKSDNTLTPIELPLLPSGINPKGQIFRDVVEQVKSELKSELKDAIQDEVGTMAKIGKNYKHHRYDNTIEPVRLDLNPTAQWAAELVNMTASVAIQDGLLAYYTLQAPLADANVEKRLETEPFQWPYGSCGEYLPK